MDRASTIAEPLGGVRVGRLARLASLAWLHARRPFLERRIRRPVLERIDGLPFVVLPEVLNPVVFRSGAFLARTVAAAPAARQGARALDMGTGSGVGAVFAARRGFQVVGVDLNPDAVRCARANVLLNGLEERIEIRHGDLFGPVSGERFDLVLWNPPFFRGEPTSNFDLAWRATDVMERFAAGLAGVLAPGGAALVLVSTDGDAEGMVGALAAQGFALEVAARRHFGSEIMTVYRAGRERGGNGRADADRGAAEVRDAANQGRPAGTPR
ncbi:MAG TPA: methyltransferase [Thermoanaerobaculia bacterium]|nr:methyltransferase [Thermoanaerobaculia bacterium]